MSTYCFHNTYKLKLKNLENRGCGNSLTIILLERGEEGLFLFIFISLWTFKNEWIHAIFKIKCILNGKTLNSSGQISLIVMHYEILFLWLSLGYHLLYWQLRISLPILNFCQRAAVLLF